MNPNDLASYQQKPDGPYYPVSSKPEYGAKMREALVTDETAREVVNHGNDYLVTVTGGRILAPSKYWTSPAEPLEVLDDSVTFCQEPGEIDYSATERGRGD